MSAGDLAAAVAAAVRLLPRLARRAPFAELNRDLYAVIYGLGRRGWFVNKGFAPVDPAMPRVPELAAEPHGAALYFEVLSHGAAVLGRPPARVVEAACGPGGGLLLAAAMWPGARLLGFDLQPAALRTGAAGRVMLAAADGFRLPVAAGTAELLVSVEGLLNLGRDAFLAEARRVLAPGGVLAATASMGLPFAAARQAVEDSARAAGFEVALLRDMAAGIVAASRADAARRLGWARFLPRPARRPIESFAAAPGSAIHEAYASGARSYYLVVLRRAD